MTNLEKPLSALSKLVEAPGLHLAGAPAVGCEPGQLVLAAVGGVDVGADLDLDLVAAAVVLTLAHLDHGRADAVEQVGA